MLFEYSGVFSLSHSLTYNPRAVSQRAELGMWLLQEFSY